MTAELWKRLDTVMDMNDFHQDNEGLPFAQLVVTQKTLVEIQNLYENKRISAGANYISN